MAQHSTVDIEEFVKRFYVDRVPYKAAKAYAASEVPKLAKMLRDDRYSPYASNIVVVMGIIGGQVARNTLIEFITQAKVQQLDQANYHAAVSALLALGYVVNRDEDEKAIEYLAREAQYILDTEKWFDKSDDCDSKGRRLNPQSVARTAILALSLGGHGKSAEALKNIQRVAKSRMPPIAQIGDIEVFLKTALERHEFVRKEGLEAYYGRR